MIDIRSRNASEEIVKSAHTKACQIILTFVHTRIALHTTRTTFFIVTVWALISFFVSTYLSIYFNLHATI